MNTLISYFVTAIFSLLAISGVAKAQTKQSLVGLWYNDDNRLATVEKDVFRQHCSDGRLIWIQRLETSSIAEWEIYMGIWRIKQNTLTYKVTLFERAQAPSFTISRKTNLTSSFDMLVGRVDSSSFQFERRWGFPPRGNVARRVDAVPLPRVLRDKASCEQTTS
ncbi:hypothetical protein [Roseibium sp. SCP14]|uniref:hypothetical protein n=1 Tax=Roseibium sp. SCP14 TaxID=3141375 RepID=UPI00333DC7CA